MHVRRSYPGAPPGPVYNEVLDRDFDDDIEDIARWRAKIMAGETLQTIALESLIESPWWMKG